MKPCREFTRFAGILDRQQWNIARVCLSSELTLIFSKMPMGKVMLLNLKILQLFKSIKMKLSTFFFYGSLRAVAQQQISSKLQVHRFTFSESTIKKMVMDSGCRIG
jgi:hypothetical protein